MTLTTALLSLVARPVDLVVRRWNWKAAFFSSLIRGIIFLLANLRSGWRAAVGAMLAEWVYRAITSGFYGAITQVFGKVEPEWEGAAGGHAPAAAVLSYARVPGPLSASHAAPEGERYLVPDIHLFLDAVQRLCHAARHHGVGKDCASLAADLRAMPRMIGGFIAVVPLWAWRSLRSREA